MPKALVPVNGKPLLEHVLLRLIDSGYDDIIINVHHFAQQIIDFLKSNNGFGVKIEFSDESAHLLDTGGGLKKASWFFNDQEPFLIHNVDIISDLSITALFKYHILRKGLATLAVRHRSGNRFFLIDSSGIVRGWRNNATGEQIIPREVSEDLSEIAFSGVHIIEPEIFRFMDQGIFTMTSLYLQLAGEHDLYTFCDDAGYWGDIGTPESLEYIRKLI
jgi:NDP-sugar pyrophosphorylase family protein